MDKKVKSTEKKAAAARKTAAAGEQKAAIKPKAAKKPAAAKKTLAAGGHKARPYRGEDKSSVSCADSSFTKGAVNEHSSPMQETIKPKAGKKTPAAGGHKARLYKGETVKKKAAGKPAAVASPQEPARKLKVLIAVSEVVPFMATGGMGQVAGALATTLARNEEDLDIRVVTPLYSQFRAEFEPQMYWIGERRVSLAWRYDKYCGVFRLEKDGVTYYFVDNRAYFERNSAYGHYDDGERFAFFAKAVFATIDISGFVPDIIHAHDWQTALVPIYLKTRFAHQYRDIKSVFTLHNMEYQGKFASFTLTDVFDLWSEEEWMVTQWVTSHDKCLNLMKGAIVCADKITTVSPSYAGEIQVAGAYGLEQTIRENAYKLSGIINGIDINEYNPATDPVIAAKYTPDTLGRKAENKKALQSMFYLPENPHSMLFCVVSRLVSHKGMDLIKYMIDGMLQLDTQFVLLGTGDPDYEWFFGELAARYPGKVGVKIAFEPAVASMIYAGSDALLMPSSTEPCGLAQMIACRYGTIPIVRKTGGLGDTISDCRLGAGNGFVFSTYTPGELFETVKQAYEMYTAREEDWHNLMREAMKSDFSWGVPAKAYADLYRGIV